MSEPDPVLYARCSLELLESARAAANAREQTLGGFIRLAVTKAIENTGGNVAKPKKLARRKQRA